LYRPSITYDSNQLGFGRLVGGNSLDPRRQFKHWVDSEYDL